MGKTLGKVSYDGFTFELRENGILKVIECRKGNARWEVAHSLTEHGIDKIWADIKAEAKVAA